jgi:CRP-like cAMP-binding protein
MNDLGKISQVLEALDADGRHRFLALAQRRTVPAGHVIFREGEEGEEFFVLAKGRLRVSADNLGTEKELAVLEHGSFFGEGSMSGNHQRSATITALEEAQIVAFHGPEVRALLASYPKALEVLNRVGLQRAEETLEKLSE